MYSWSVFLTYELAILKKENSQISCDVLSNFYSWKKTRAARDIWWSYSKTIPIPSNETQAHVKYHMNYTGGIKQIEFSSKINLQQTLTCLCWDNCSFNNAVHEEWRTLVPDWHLYSLLISRQALWRTLVVEGKVFPLFSMYFVFEYKKGYVGAWLYLF